MSSIVLYNLQPSPNSKKIRLALGYKGIAHEVVQVDPMDRATVVAISGQPLTPVLKHGENVMFDSGAILRYIEANVKREPRLFSAEYDAMKAIERWEAQGKADLGGPISSLFGQFFSGSPNPAAMASAADAFNAAARHIEKNLNSDGYLVGSGPTAGDLVCASYLWLGLLSPEQASSHPIMGFFAENLRLDPECVRLRTWYRSIDRFDA